MTEMKKYSQKWGINYKGKTYLVVYGKRNAYDLHYRLSSYLSNLTVVPVYTSLKTAPKPIGEPVYQEKHRISHGKFHRYRLNYFEKRKQKLYTLPEDARG